MTIKELPEIITAQHIASYLQISRRRVYELFKLSVQHGGIPNFEVGLTKRVDKRDFIIWLEQQKKKKAARLEF